MKILLRMHWVKFKILLALIVYFNVVPADGIVFSYDRPLQLWAFLESLYAKVSGIEDLTVIFRCSDNDFRKGYLRVKDAFRKVIFIEQKTQYQFKNLIVNTVKGSKEYLFFAVDDLVIRKHIDLHKCEFLLDYANAYGFYFRLGKNITRSYMVDRPSLPPIMEYVDSDIYKFCFKDGIEDWAYPNSVDMVLLKKSTIYPLVKSLRFSTPNTFEGSWALKANLNSYGLCFEESKIINIPVNKVNISGNRSMDDISTKELLNIFNFGYRIDIEEIAKITPVSPHMAIELKFKKLFS